MTGNNVARGTIFFDDLCPFCRALHSFLGPIFSRRGFQWRSLHTPDLVRTLRVSKEAALDEMKLQLPDQRLLGGVDSWIHLFRNVWWLWPLGFALSLPGCYAVGQRGYRWIARHRYCFGGKCRRPTPARERRKIPFFDLP